MNPQIFEDAIGWLWSGRSRDRFGVGTMRDALLRAGATDNELYLLDASLEPKERAELIPHKLIYGSVEKQACRALYLTLLGLIAEES